MLLLNLFLGVNKPLSLTVSLFATLANQSEVDPWKIDIEHVDQKQHHEPEDGVLFTLQR